MTLVGGADTTVQSGNCYRYRYTISDRVGNTSDPSAASTTAKVDTTAPSIPALTLTETSPLEYVAGDTVYYNPQGSNNGTFSVDATTTDAQSGIDAVAFPTVFGTDGAADGASPYSHDYSWTGSDTATGTKTVTATNGAGTTRTATFAVTPDTAAPTGQTVELAGGPWYTSLSVPLTVADGGDAGSGLDLTSGVVERSDATLTDGTCDTFGAWAPVTLVGGSDTTVETGSCYRYRYSISDNVGNSSGPSATSDTAQVDTTAPTVPSLTLTEARRSSTPTAARSTTTRRVRTPTPSPWMPRRRMPSPASTPSTSPTVFGTDGATDNASPYSHDYTWTATDTASGARTVTSANGSGLTSTSTFTLIPDTTAPTGQSVDLTGGPWYTSTSVPLTSTGAPTPAPASTTPHASSSAPRPPSPTGLATRSDRGLPSRSSQAPTRASPAATATATDPGLGQRRQHARGVGDIEHG